MAWRTPIVSNERRRQKYAQDPEYRTRVLERNRAYRRAHQVAREYQEGHFMYGIRVNTREGWRWVKWDAPVETLSISHTGATLDHNKAALERRVRSLRQRFPGLVFKIEPKPSNDNTEKAA